MAGLVQYDSSSEEEEVEVPVAAVEPAAKEASAEPIKVEETQPAPAPQTEDAPMIGPMMPPQDGDFSLPEPEEDMAEALQPPAELSYAEYRSALRELTYPTVPKLEFAPSPPGSPAPQVTSKAANMIRLKRNGTHFNLKLDESKAFRNPSLSKKLLDFAGVKGDDQYSTVLPTTLWNPTGFPSWARVSELYELSRTKTRAPGKNPTFVPPTTADRTYQTPQSEGGLAKRQKRKAGAE